MQRELSQTLIELLESVNPPDNSGLIVTEAEIDVPLETSGAVQKGELIFLANVAHSRWKAGFLPPVTMTKIRFRLNED